MWRRIITPLLNARGQLNLSSLQQFLSGGIPFLNTLTSNPTLTGLPRTVEQLGGAAALLYGLTDKPTVTIPDFGSFATPQGAQSENYLLGLNNPLTYNDLLAKNVAGTASAYAPYLAPGPGTTYLQGVLQNPLSFGQSVTQAQQALSPILAPGPGQQFLTGLFQSPSDPFAAGGIYSKYLPLLEQQKTALLNDVQQRAIAGLPGSLSTAMSGSELAAIRDAVVNQITPRYQSLFADLTRENMARQAAAAESVMGQERFGQGLIANAGGNIFGLNQQALQNAANQLLGNEQDIRRFVGDVSQQGMSNQINSAINVLGFEKAAQLYGFEAALQAAQQSAEAERDRNNRLQQLGLALLLNPNAGGGVGVPGVPGTLPGQLGQASQSGQPGQGTVGDAIRRYLGGAGGVQPGQWYSPIGQMGVADILGQMQAGTLSTAEGLSLLLRTQGLPLLGTGVAGYGTGQLASMIGGNQAQSSALGGAGGAAAGAILGSTIFPGVGTAIGAVVGGLGGLFGGFFGERTDQQQIKEMFRQQDLDSQADQVQEIGSFFTQRLSSLGVDTTRFQQFVSQMISQSEAGSGSYSFGGWSGNDDQQQAVADIGGKLLLQALQQANPSLTSLTQVPGLRAEFIDYLTRTTFSGENSAYGGGAPLNQFPGWAAVSGLAKGGSLPWGGPAIVGEGGQPELLLAAPGSAVLPMALGTDGAYQLDWSALRRPVSNFNRSMTRRNPYVPTYA